MALLEFHSTTKQYRSRTALDNLTLYVSAGEIYGFLGPNGAGKTTAIHIAMGFLRSTSGGGMIAGMPFGSKWDRSQIGFVPDAPTFLGGTATEAVELAGALTNMPHGELRERSRDLLEFLDLPQRGLDVRKFSRGMQQRLALAQALVHRPKVLLLDEPTSALDPPSVMTVRGILEHERKQGTAIFFSSHQLAEVEQLCDRIGFLRSGRMLRTGRLDDLLAEQSTVEIVVRGLARKSEPARRWRARFLDSDPRKLVFLVPVSRQREVIELIWAAGAELVSVGRQRNSLEDLFKTLELAAWPAEQAGMSMDTESGWTDGDVKSYSQEQVSRI